MQLVTAHRLDLVIIRLAKSNHREKSSQMNEHHLTYRPNTLYSKVFGMKLALPETFINHIHKENHRKTFIPNLF